MRWGAIGICVCLALLGGTVSARRGLSAEESRFAETHSRSQYVHWIDLYDESDHRIDPADPNAPPYSPLRTCGRCHDYEAIAHGFHFNARDPQQTSGRGGEPWVWVDSRTGTQLPLSYRAWPGTFDPRKLGITDWEFVLQFGRHLPGGGPGEPAAEAPAAKEAAQAPEAKESKDAAEKSGAAGRWTVSGPLHVDCLICHSGDFSYSLEAWRDQIAKQNFSWAATAASGLGTIEGAVAELPEGFDPAKPADAAGPKLPKTAYAPARMTADKKVFVDIVRTPRDNACYHCHSSRLVGAGTEPEWTHDQDVHLRAGMTCTDCHRNGIEHQTVRGYEGEQHPTGVSVATLSCRGCHLGETAGAAAGGRLGAPKPLHQGLPPLHLAKIACTACHSGPRPGAQAVQVQTAMAHGLGLPSHDYAAENPPGIVTPVLLQDGGVLYPHRMMWPAFWGTLANEQITPLHPEVVNEALRRTIRVRRGSTFAAAMSEVKLTADDKVKALGEERARTPESELNEQEKAKLEAYSRSKAGEAFLTKLAEALKQLQTAVKQPGATAVYVSAGKLYQLSGEGVVTASEHAGARPYAWKLGHDVRPARWSVGAGGCFDCHANGSPFFNTQVTAMGPAPDSQPVTRVMHELAGFDQVKLAAWNQSFQGRTAFKYFGFAAMTAVALIVLSYTLLGINGIFAWAKGK